MQDYDLTLLPQSRVRFRLGYSRYVEEGPSLTTEDATVEIPMAQNFRMTTNAYRMGVDFRVLPKTTISYDQFLEYNKYDTSDTLANTPFLVQTNRIDAPGTLPVNLGINWYYPPTATTAPCAAPLLATASLSATARRYCPQVTYNSNRELQDGPVVSEDCPHAEFHAHGAAELSVHIYPKAGDVRFGQLQQQPTMSPRTSTIP